MTDEANRRKKLAIIDGKSVFYRGYYAMPNLATKDGTPTGGVYGFAVMALEVIKRLKPDYVCVAWDKPKTNIRKRLELYPEYKAGRKPAPPDFYDQVPLLHELLEAFGWPLYELDDYEADDIMGTLACQATAQDIETMLVTSDLDMLQLVDPHVHVYALKTGLSNIELYSPKSFEAKYGIRVEQFLDLKSLKGDSSDNIPGVPGIGEKGAVELLQTYGTLDNIYDNLDLIKDSTRKKLEAGKDLAYLSKKLAAIWTDAPLKLDLAAMDGSKCQPKEVLELLEKFEFRSLARQLPEIMQVAIGDYQANNGHTSARLQPEKVVNVESPAKLSEVELAQSEHIYMHGRAAGAHGQRPQLLALSAGQGTTYVLDLAKLDTMAILNFLSTRCHLPSTKLVGYDVKRTLKILLELGLTDLPPVGHDVLTAAFVLNCLQREQSLSELAHAELSYDGSPLEDIDNQEFASRAGEITAVLKALHNKQAKALAEVPKYPELVKDIEWPVILVLARMEHRGIRLDTAYLGKFSEEIEDSIVDLEQQIYGLADDEFNIGSPTQLAEVLFGKMALPTMGIKRGKTGYSTAASELDKLRGTHEVINLITAWREVTKLKNTYVETLPKLVDEDSRLHTTYKLTIAQTGRLSSTDPNLQNIPVRTDLGRHIRTAFVASPGMKLISADYSQFELRLAAVLAEDKELIDLFNGGIDIHAATAAQIYGRQLADVTKTMRRAAKVINFGIIYGMSPHGLSVATGMPLKEAAEFIDKYKDLRRPLFDYMERTKQFAKREGYVETLFGRRRPTPDIHSSNFVVRSAAERAAINMPIQGTEADLMKLAMINIDREIEKAGLEAYQLLQIHDSVLVECPTDQAKKTAKLLKETMESVYELPAKLTVDVAIGENWGEL